MISVVSSQCQPAFASRAASTDFGLLSVLPFRNTQHLALKATMIPSSPANRIMPRIFEGNSVHKVSNATHIKL